jgi:hypothetical protein
VVRPKAAKHHRRRCYIVKVMFGLEREGKIWIWRLLLERGGSGSFRERIESIVNKVSPQNKYLILRTLLILWSSHLDSLAFGTDVVLSSTLNLIPCIKWKIYLSGNNIIIKDKKLLPK